MKLSARAVIIFCIVCVVVIAGNALGTMQPIEQPFARILSGVSGYGRTLADVLARPFRSQDDRDAPLARIVSLEHDLAVCRLARADSATLEEMERIAIEREGVRLIPSRLIGISPDPDHSLIIINQGAADGVKPGSGVIAGDGIFVGKVVSTTAFSSSVRLPIDSRSKIIATFASTTPSRGLVEGQFQVGLRMNLIPNTQEIAVGSPVVTSGLEAGIPSGFVIGRIRDIQSQPTDLFKSASLEPSVDYKSLRLVSVVVQKEEQ